MSHGAPEDGATGVLLDLGDGARRIGRWVRYLPDRLLHPLRRRRARDRLRDTAVTGPVLFVCHGNICRSPYAERVFLRHPATRLPATSAGFTGPGRHSPDTAIRVAAERSIELASHTSRLVTDALLRRAGLVVVMEPRQSLFLRSRYGVGRALVLGDLDPGPILRRAVRDPIFQSAEVFRSVYDRIDRCVEELAVLVGPGDGGTPRTPRAGGTAGG